MMSTRFSSDQITILEKKYLENSRIGAYEASELGKQINLSQKQVSRWFYRKRTRSKSKSEASKSMDGKSFNFAEVFATDSDDDQSDVEVEILHEKKFCEKALIDSIKSVFDNSDDEDGADEKNNLETCKEDEIKKLLAVFEDSDEENNAISKQ